MSIKPKDVEGYQGEEIDNLSTLKPATRKPRGNFLVCKCQPQVQKEPKSRKFLWLTKAPVKAAV